jgi:subtilisin-like proprotein convertase family protein
MKALRTSLVILLLLIPFTLFAQILDVSNNVPNQRKDAVTLDNQNMQKPMKFLNENTDEYGTGSANVFLGGLGSTAGYIAVGDAGGLYNLTTSGTVEVWVMPTATTSSTPIIVGKGDNTNLNWILAWSSSSSLLGFRIGNSYTTNTGGTTVPLNQWSHVAVTWTGSAGSYTLNFYVNGALSGSSATNTGTFNSTTATDSLTIGSTRAGFSGKDFYGYIDELKIWNVVRTQAQIAQTRFTGIGDYASANTGSAITYAANYTGLLSSFTMNNHYRDDIAGITGYARNGAGLYWYGLVSGYPMPYNYSIKCPFEAAGYVTVADNAGFNQSAAGTVEAWVYPTGQTTTHMLISRGTTGFDFFWGIRSSASNKMAVDIGSGTQFVNTDGVTIPMNKWTHVAATWTAGTGNYTVTFYVNGQQSGAPITNTTTWSSTSGTLRIGGWHGGTANNFNGYMDEVRFWSGARTAYQIKQGMLASCRQLLPNATLIGAWNFDGNLKNFSATTGIDGSFNTAATNNTRFSAYSNESTTGSIPAATFAAHPTVLSATAFPLGYNLRIVNTSIPDNSSLTDVMPISGNTGNVTDVKVVLAIQHANTGDLTVKLKAPNNTEVTLSTTNGGVSPNGYLTCLDDSASYLITSTLYISPWSGTMKPQNAMGTFGSSPRNGNWTLTVTDGAAGNTGTLLGWGIRLNGTVVLGTPNITGNLPEKFDLFQNYPNPFNPVTKIKFAIPTNENVRLSVFDVLGREIQTIVDKKMEAGNYEYDFDGSRLSSGVYFYKIVAGNYTSIKKMMLIK